ncbi:2-oxo acid dehydrogenase subunit E2 [Saliphagus sp. GCM10025317]
MGYTVRMPQLGMTMEEGVVVEWSVNDEEFESGDVVAVIESEKTANDVEAREGGVLLERFVDLDEPVEPGAPIAYVGEPGASVPDEILAELEGDDGEGDDEEPTDGEPATTTESAGGGAALAVEGKVSPRARTYARDNDLDVDESALATLNGSGPDGAVVERDVIDAVEAGTLGEAGEPAVPDAPTATGRGIYEERQGSQLRRSVARQMATSAEQAPQVTLNRSASVESLLALKDRLSADRDLQVSLTDFLLKAVARTLRDHPEFNAVYEGGVHKLAANVNVGVAVDVDDGLVTPVLDQVDELDLAGINAARSELVDRVQSREFTMEDLSDGTFTVTNLGHFGVETFDPLLNVPEVAILGVGTITQQPTGDGDVEPHIGLSLTFDHRAVDGADAAKFLETLADELEHPTRLLLLGGASSNESADRTGAFRERADELEGRRRTRTVSDGSMRGTVQSRRFEWDVDEPEDHGGDDTAPTPVEQFLGSLSSCLTLMIGSIAERRDVEIDQVEVEVDAEPDHDAIERLEVDITVTSPADESDVERVVQTAERACYVNRIVSDDLDQSMTITVEQS